MTDRKKSVVGLFCCPKYASKRKENKMDEQISTTVEATETQTTQETPENQTTEDTQNTQPDDVQEPVNNEAETTETESQEQKPEPPKDWEKIAKDNQASFTKVSQELAELKKQMQESKPKLVEQGKINPEFEQQYKFDIDNREFLAYDNLARQLEPEARDEVEKLLGEARRLYNPNNNRAYEAKMATIKDYFRSDLVEQIANEKQKLFSQMKSKFDEAIAQDKQERANQVANAIEQVPELKELVVPESDNYSREVFDIVKTMFDCTGGVDIEATTKAITKIKELGVKEYLAKQSAQKEKNNATVPDGSNVVQKTSTGMPSAQEMIADPKLYEKAVKKFGMDKVDAVIMKG